ncbi:MAG: glycoside hydrolase family 99-like domain-containing protein [Anaerolineae bacterium]|nr:glycoside hydrolase family 99-like domain-containing protein [Anaerolineae bacterium]
MPVKQSEKSVMIGAYYYPWYSPERHWDSGYRGTPLLGEYDSADPAVIHQHISWAQAYGVDFFALSWWGKDSFEDNVIRDPFLDVAKDRNFPFAVLYESAGLLKMHNGKIDLDVQSTRQQLISDFAYLGQQMLQDPHLFKIDGHPVIFLYLTRTFTGDVHGALSEAKAAAVDAGSAEPYLVGDEVYWQYPDKERLGFYDAVTAYNMHTSVPDIADGFAENVDRQYQLWARIADQQGIPFIPNIMPGFDDTAVRPEARHPVIPRSVSLFTAQLQSAKALASGPQPVVMITSWNEWHEDTSIEPAAEEGTAYLEVLLESP